MVFRAHVSVASAVELTDGNQDREAVFPTRQSLGIMKAKLKGAETGHSLLKRKSEALTKYVEPCCDGPFARS